MFLNSRNLLKTMSYVQIEMRGFAGIAWMHAGMRGHSRKNGIPNILNWEVVFLKSSYLRF